MFSPNQRFASRHTHALNREVAPEEVTLAVLECDRCARVATRLTSLRGDYTDFVALKAEYQAWREEVVTP